MTTKDMATETGLSVGTVKLYLAQIYGLYRMRDAANEKLDMRTSVVIWAVREWGGGPAESHHCGLYNVMLLKHIHDHVMKVVRESFCRPY